MSHGEQLYLALVLTAFAGFAALIAFLSISEARLSRQEKRGYAAKTRPGNLLKPREAYV